MKSNPSSVFGLATILAFLTFPVLAQTPAGVPSLDEMAGDWLPMKDVANPPDVNNFHDMLIINRDLTSFFCNPEDWLWGWGMESGAVGYPPVTLTIAGKEYPATECRWYPYRALRRNPDCGGLAVETDTRMINEQRAVLVRVQIANPSTTKTNVELALSVSGLLQPDGISVLNTNQRPGFATVVCPATKPDSVTNDNGVVRWQWKVALSAGGKKEIEFVAGDGHAADSPKVQADVTRWRKHFSAEFDGFKHCWEQRWADAFTPGNQHFSGSLPVLVTDNAGAEAELLHGHRHDAGTGTHAVSGASAIVHHQRRARAGHAVLLGRLDAEHRLGAARTRRHESHLAPLARAKSAQRTVHLSHRHQRLRCEKFTTTSPATLSTPARFSKRRWIIFASPAIWLFSMKNWRTAKPCCSAWTKWPRTGKRSSSPTARWPITARTRTCLNVRRPTSIALPSCNAQNVWMMRQDAALQELKGHAARAKELRDDAEKLLPAVLSLYKPGDGVWYGLHNDGKRVELRHCVDYIYVGNALANDLTPDMRREMTDFVKRELLTRDWMRAMSLKDAAAAVSDRPDHGPMGAYDGWPALTVGTMWRLGFPNDAFDFYCRTAEVTKEGPFAQAREFYGPYRNQYDAPVRIAEREGCMKECISGAAFSDVVINTFFGFAPSLDGKNLLADPQTPRPFTGKLLNVSTRGKKFTISAGKSGVDCAKK